MAWTDERVELLKQLWGEGLSASQIAGRLGSVTRNSVIGKVHKLGLSGRTTTSRKPQTRKQRQGQIAYREDMSVIRQVFAAKPEEECEAKELVIPPKERRSIETLGYDDCRWPIGDPQQADFHFCGKRKVPTLSYCEFHVRRAYILSRTRDRSTEAVSA